MDQSDSNRITLTSYESHVQDYITGTPQTVDGDFKTWIDTALDLAPTDTPILELGSAFGRDAAYIESRGFAIERTDAVIEFVKYLKRQGHRARVLNAITDQPGQGYGMIFANAVFLHFTRHELATTLSKLFMSLRSDGILAFSVKKGEGEGWSEDKLHAPRYFCYWQLEPLQKLVVGAGFKIITNSDAIVGSKTGQEWLHIIARRV